VTANGPPRPLPVRLRPLTGETGESYIHRLARSNHLRPSHLRRYLATPAGSYGPINPSRLAALSGRALPALLRALPDLTPRPRRQGVIREADAEKQRNQAKKRALFIAIRRDARAGMSDRAITRKHKVGKRTVDKALTSPTPPPRKKINRPPAALNGLHDHINAMINSNPEIQSAEVWRQLVDLHDATASYHTVNVYVINRRVRSRPI
jgi:hypothetical protein